MHVRMYVGLDNTPVFLLAVTGEQPNVWLHYIIFPYLYIDTRVNIAQWN